jgi:hypothetical protein
VRLSALVRLTLFLLSVLASSAGAQRTVTPAAKSTTIKNAPISFLNQVEPILTRAGCNQGACHGSQFGKGSYKLSLAGYDPDFDYESTVRQLRGRRINFADPQRSLFLAKPSLTVAHAGGRRLSPKSADYRTLLEWVKSGAPPPNPRDPQVTSLVISPPQKTLKIGQRVPLRVVAFYNNGTKRDVTAHARIHSIEDQIAAVTPEGMVTAKRHGATAVMVRYQGLAAAGHITVPYANAQKFAWKPANFIDELAAQKWRTMGLIPSSAVTDRVFVRRVFFDLIGTAPTPAEIETFLRDRSLQKRERLIDHLLQRPEYVDYWTVKWSDLLRANRTLLGEKSLLAFNAWIRDNLQTNRPYDKMVHSLLTAQGGSYKEGAVNFFRSGGTPQDLTETTAQLFLGIRLQCAKCHQHPFEKWSQRDYYQFAAFFARIERSKADTLNVEQTVTVAAIGEVSHPKTNAVMTPAPLPLGSKTRLLRFAASNNPKTDRRVLLADWLTQKDNRQFAKTVVNRYWSYLMGRGIVHPADDMRVTNPPSNPELLDALSQDFIAHGYDLKHLIKTICLSQVYQRSSTSLPQNQQDEVFFSHALPKRMGAEVLLDAISFATGAPEPFLRKPEGTRAIQLPDVGFESRFLETFGRPLRNTVCECERVNEPDLPQALLLLNGERLNAKISQPNGRAAILAASSLNDWEIVNEVYQVTLARPPSAAERKLTTERLNRSMDRQAAIEDILWGLINMKEFAEIR